MISRLSPDPRRRTSLTISAWALSLLLLPPLACSGAAAPDEEAAPAAQRDLLELLPASARAVGHVDVDAVRGSVLFDLAVGDDGIIGDSDDLREFVDRTGIDPHRDLRRVAFATLAGDAGLDAAVVLAEATFDRARLEETLAELPSEEWSGRTVYTLGSWSREQEPGEPETADAPEEPEAPDAPDAEEDAAADNDDSEIEVRSGHLVILEDDLLVTGSAPGVRSVLEVLEGAASVRSNEQLFALIRDARPGDAEVWAVSAQEDLLDQVGSPQGIPVDKIRAFLMSIDLDDGIAASLRGRTGSEEDADLLGESLRGMLAFGKMMLQRDHPEIFEIVDRGIRAGSSGYDVTLRASLSPEDLETLRAFARRELDGKGEEGAAEG